MFYDVYVKLCTQKGISPTRAAEEIGISRATPTTWKKRGLTPQGETLNKLANYFGVTIDSLIGVADIDMANTAIEDKTNSSAEALAIPTEGKVELDSCLREIQLLKQALDRGVRGNHTLYQLETTMDKAIDLRESIAPADKQHLLVILADIERNLLDHDVRLLEEKIRTAKEQLL